MKRRNFLKTSALFTTTLILPSFIEKLLAATTIRGINLPGSHLTVKPKSYSLKKNDDMNKYFNDAADEIIQKVPSQRARYETVMKNFNSYPKGYNRNGYNGISDINGDIKTLLNEYGKFATTPTFSHKSTWNEFNISTYCDASMTVITDDNSIIVQPIDGRPDQSPYIVESTLAYILFNPKFYCIGLPSSFPSQYAIDDKKRKEIYLKTGKETTRPYYKVQQFSFYGSSLCANGFVKGPDVINLYYNTDEAINIYLNLTDIESCGDPKDYAKKCNLKI